MRFDVLTLFPKMFEGPMDLGLVGQAIKANNIQFKTWDIRDAATDNHKTVDDKPFGGGDGMVMLPETLKATLERVMGSTKTISNGIPNISQGAASRRRVIYLSPQGQLLTQKRAQDFASQYDQIILICGRYGGIDERFIEKYVDEEISVGDYIVTGGELPAMILIDAVSRFVPGTLGNEKSALEETFKDSLLEEPLYTKPREFEGMQVPEVLTSGHHQNIDKWKRQQRIKRTLEKRPDLLRGSQATRDELLEAQNQMQLRKRVAVGLVHYPVYNKAGQVVATNVTNLDVHDIARACRTYGVDQYYIITPMEEQLAFVGRLIEHWQSGRGMQYNPVRSDSLVNLKAATSIEAAIEDWGVPGTKMVATSARAVAGPQPINADQLREVGYREPLFMVFGTGWGLENALVRQCDYLLEPIRGRSPDGFRHLSVRSAVSIILDRLFGPCY